MSRIVLGPGRRLYDIDNLDLSMTTLEEVADSLSKQCRYNGNTKRYYSVAEHCWLVAEILIQTPDTTHDDWCWGLLHDAAEAWIGDITAPIKNCLGAAYKEIESLVDKGVARRWMPGRKPVDTPFFHHVDKQVAFSTELRDVVKPLGWSVDAAPHPELSVKGLPPRRAAQLFMDTAEDLWDWP